MAHLWLGNIQFIIQVSVCGMELKNKNKKPRKPDIIEKMQHEYKVMRLISSCHILKQIFYLYIYITRQARLLRFFFLGDSYINSIWSLSIDHATHSGLFYVPWHLIAQLIHSTLRGWFSTKSKGLNVEGNQTPSFPRGSPLGTRSKYLAWIVWWQLGPNYLVLPLKSFWHLSNNQGLCRWLKYFHGLFTQKGFFFFFCNGCCFKTYFCISVTSAATT